MDTSAMPSRAEGGHPSKTPSIPKETKESHVTQPLKQHAAARQQPEKAIVGRSSSSLGSDATTWSTASSGSPTATELPASSPGARTRRTRPNTNCNCGANADRRRPALASAATLLTCAPPGISRLYRILDEANAPAFALDLTGHVAFWNQKLTEITGLPPADVVGRSLSDLVATPNASDLASKLEQALADAETTVRDVEISLNTPALGRNVRLLVNLTVDVDENDVSSVLAIGQDVTLWRLQGAQYASVAQQINAPIVMMDRDGRITLWNPQAEALTGYTIGQVMGTSLLDMVHEDFRVLVGEMLARVTSTNTAVPEFELPLVTASGARVELMLSLTPQVGDDGAGSTATRIVAIGQDITERNASEMEYSKLVDSANAPIFGVDTDGCVVIFNKKAAQISEYWPGEVMGADLVSFLIHEDYRSEVAA
ncbi:hypothetical protein BBJ28_00006220, partial [Nothophytophthora sp. Chile5]